MGGLLGSAWNVRVAILKALRSYLSTVALTAPADSKPALTAAAILERLLPTLQTLCIRDAKYATVRVAALEALLVLLKRLTAVSGNAAPSSASAAAATSSFTAGDASSMARSSEVVAALRALFDELKEDRDPHVLRLLQDISKL